MSQSKWVGAIAGLAMLTGCGGSEDLTPSSDVTGQGMSWEQFLSGVYQEPNTGIFIVDGDTPVANEKLLREFYEKHVRNGQLIVQTVGTADDVWSAAKKKNLTYCVSTTFGNNHGAVVAAMASAAAAWEAAADVDFIYVSAQDANCNVSNTNVVFDVRPEDSGGIYLARAFFPGDSRDKQSVGIDPSSFGNLGTWTLAGILRHELGHTLGFRHEHTRPESGRCTERSNWRALTTYDSASVMHYPHCNGTQTGDLVLTAKDIEGAVAIYGTPGGTNPDPEPQPGTPTSETRTGSVAVSANVNYGPFTVVAGTQFKVAMTGTGDPDLYVRFGAAPTTTQYNCRPYSASAAETCDLTVPAGTTTAYVMVRGYKAATFNLAINYTKP